MRHFVYCARQSASVLIVGRHLMVNPYYSAVKKERLWLLGLPCINLKTIKLRKRSQPATKENILNGSIYVKFKNRRKSSVEIEISRVLACGRRVS